MATIAPLKGLRYSKTAGTLADLVAPPYDVIDDSAQERYYRRHPYNIIRLEYGKTHPTDGEKDNRYTRAAADFSTWQKEGILVREAAPALYLYEHRFAFCGEQKVRRGFICAVRLEPYEKGVVLPHEETLPKHKADRLALMRACAANFSPIFGLYADEEKTVEELLFRSSNRSPEVSFSDENGHSHTLWVVTDPPVIEQVRQAMTGRRIYIADGHHRYETALAYRNERRAEESANGRERPYDYVMMTLFNLYDPGLVILPTHRLVRNVPELDLEILLSRLKENFQVEDFPLAPDRKNLKAFLALLNKKGEAVEKQPQKNPGRPAHPCAFGLYAGKGRLFLLTQKEAQPDISRAMGGPPSFREQLDVSVLHTLILKQILGIDEELLAEESRVAYTREEEKALAAVDSGLFQLAFFLNPTRVEEVIAVAAQGERLPQKSTYFYPKLITGLVINSLN
jgi:uncharacterized protein (DUF1015 family)